ncbi:leucine-rich repeat extensin-like protein 5 [Rhagoletis pomonella]|uniref:leucine-rich repeat extensin-like protein 5 n=1 Tax=Rhagoletis pomonella TaxID=28610 RepID=UPI001780EF82|nr:leucine-rich repeat extensin-like protein 5 [Rhagoletis pomonella]
MPAASCNTALYGHDPVATFVSSNTHTQIFSPAALSTTVMPSGPPPTAYITDVSGGSPAIKRYPPSSIPAPTAVPAVPPITCSPPATDAYKPITSSTLPPLSYGPTASSAIPYSAHIPSQVVASLFPAYAPTIATDNYSVSGNRLPSGNNNWQEL